MKNKNTRKNLSVFSKRNTHKRRSKEKAALMRAAEECGYSADRAHFSVSFDDGRRARSSSKTRRDETVAEGVFSSSRSGFGFVSVEGLPDDIFIPEGKCGGAIDGDGVEIIYHSYVNSYGEERTEGRVSEIVSPRRAEIVGTVYYDEVGFGRKRRRIAYLLADDPKLSDHFRVTGDCPEEGEKVLARLNRQGGHAVCEIIKCLGKTYSKEANYEAILLDCEITTDFTDEELSEAERAAGLPICREGRHEPSDIIYTIDGEDAKDLDDAISVRRTRGGFRLGVHIADVSHYVAEKTHLDRAVMARGTSVYFTDKVVPMLPTALSNGACSLNAGEEKYALSAMISLSDEGEILSIDILPTIIKSRLRGVYSEVNAIFDGTADAELRKKYKAVTPSLMRARELYSILKKKSELRGSVELDSPEATITLDGSGVPIEIAPRKRGTAEQMIEQFMLTANEAVATLLYEKGIPCVFRVHDDPPPEKLIEFLTYAHNLGLNISGITPGKCEPRDFSRLLSEAEERGLSLPVSYTMLRSMSKAKYSAERSRHFGLGIEFYCHFTSPIRRLSDLATHRIIHRVLLDGKSPERYRAYARRAAAAASEAEMRALSAERRIENLYKVIYMQRHIGEIFDAVVCSVTSFGLFVRLDNTCEGLIPISDIGEHFIYEEKTASLRGGAEQYKLCDTVRVRLEEADIVRGKLRFSLEERKYLF